MRDYRPPRSTAVRALNAAGRVLSGIGLRGARLDPETLVRRACRATGLSDLGDEAFREPLEILTGALEREAQLSPVGRLIAQRDLMRALEARLRLVHDREQHPEIAAETISRPLFIVGLPRTGSTILHELMAQDPDNRTPMTWECMWPSPRPEAATCDTDPRIAKADAHFAAVDQLIPGFKAMHPMGARLPQECVMLMNHEFVSMQYHCSFRIPTYQDWFDRHDLRPVYESHRRQLQHLQSRWPARAGWVLKSPQHLWTLEALLDVYPDAQLVQTHRDPVKVAASLASLVSLLRGMASDDVDPFDVGRDWTLRLETGLARCLELRLGSPELDRRFFDLHFSDFTADPIGSVERIYAHCGRRLGDEAADRMRAFLAANPRDKHGRHEYTLRGAGLDLESERSRFEAYQKHFDVPSEF